MTTTPVDALKTGPGGFAVTKANVDTWLREDPHFKALLFAGVNNDRIEGHDVAVALREMLRLYPQSLSVGVVETADEMRIKDRFGVIVLPTLVILNRGEVLERMPRVRNWSDYAELFTRYLGKPRIMAA
jgi:hydrogenase-1 operon protein HyaE